MPRATSGLMMALLCIAGGCLLPVEARATRRTTVAPQRHQHLHHWPPLVAPPPPGAAATSTTDNAAQQLLLDEFDLRSPNGEHEYRYELSNGDARYERSYWLPVGKDWILARVGYYSMPLPNAKYSTVFYHADHHGYHVDTHTLSEEQPLLPRTLDVPHDMVAATKSTPAAKRNSISVPERNDSQQHKDNSDHIEHIEEIKDTQDWREQLPTGGSDAKVQTVGHIQLKPNSHKELKTLAKMKAMPSSVAKDEDNILAAEAEDDNDDGDDDDVDAKQ